MGVGHGVYESALAMRVLFDDVEGVLVGVVTERIALVQKVLVQSWRRGFMIVRTHRFVGLFRSGPFLCGIDCLERQVSRSMSIDRQERTLDKDGQNS